MGSLATKMIYKSKTDKFAKTVINFKDINVIDIDGANKKLGEYVTDKKAIIFVNTASECGLTNNNYRQLVSLYDKYSKNGLQILGFPCNQFHSQENKCELDIKNFTKNKFHVTFPIFSKIDVNGENTHNVYKYLKENSELNEGGGQLRNIPWNFAKFLVDSKGNVIAYYDPQIEPDKIIPDLTKLLH